MAHTAVAINRIPDPTCEWYMCQISNVQYTYTPRCYSSVNGWIYGTLLVLVHLGQNVKFEIEKLVIPPIPILLMLCRNLVWSTRDSRRKNWMIFYFSFRFVILTLQSITNFSYNLNNKSNIYLTECQFTDLKITESNIRFLQDYPLPYWRWFFLT